MFLWFLLSIDLFCLFLGFSFSLRSRDSNFSEAFGKTSSVSLAAISARMHLCFYCEASVFWRFAALDLSQQTLEVGVYHVRHFHLLVKFLKASLFSPCLGSSVFVSLLTALRIRAFAFQVDTSLSGRANSVRRNVCC